MVLIDLKFSPEMEDLVIQGMKICTTRTERKGDVGDLFKVRDRWYRIVGIEADSFEYIQAWHLLEGFETPEEFGDKLMEYYPNLDCEDELYLHWFAFVILVEGE